MQLNITSKYSSALFLTSAKLQTELMNKVLSEVRRRKKKTLSSSRYQNCYFLELYLDNRQNQL
jgi:hypothetical protein